MDQRPSDDSTLATQPVTPQSPPPLRLVVSTAPQVNFAAQQNAVPVIRDIELINESDRDLTDLTIRMQASPSFLSAAAWHIDRLPAGGTFHAAGQQTHLEAQYLLSCRRACRANWCFR